MTPSEFGTIAGQIAGVLIGIGTAARYGRPFLRHCAKAIRAGWTRQQLVAALSASEHERRQLASSLKTSHEIGARAFALLDDMKRVLDEQSRIIDTLRRRVLMIEGVLQRFIEWGRECAQMAKDHGADPPPEPGTEEIKE